MWSFRQSSTDWRSSSGEDSAAADSSLSACDEISGCVSHPDVSPLTWKSLISGRTASLGPTVTSLWIACSDVDLVLRLFLLLSLTELPAEPPWRAAFGLGGHELISLLFHLEENVLCFFRNMLKRYQVISVSRYCVLSLEDVRRVLSDFLKPSWLYCLTGNKKLAPEATKTCWTYQIISFHCTSMFWGSLSTHLIRIYGHFRKTLLYTRARISQQCMW